MSQSKEHQNRNTINTTIDKPKKQAIEKPIDESNDNFTLNSNDLPVDVENDKTISVSTLKTQKKHHQRGRKTLDQLRAVSMASMQHPLVEIEFPPPQFFQETYTNAKELISIMKRYQEESGQDFYIKRYRNVYLYFLCKKCENKLSFNLHTLKNTRKETRHIHIDKEDQIVRRQKCLEWMKENANRQKSDLLNEAVKKFGFTRQKLDYTYWKSIAQITPEQIDKQIQTVELQGIEPSYPQLKLYLSKRAFQLFPNATQVMWLHIKQNITKEKTVDDGRWSVGYFLSITERYEKIMYAMCTLSSLTKQAFVWLFRNLFQKMGKPFNCLYTDDIPAIREALDELSADELFNGVCLVDVRYMIKKPYLRPMKNVATAKTRVDYEKHLITLRQEVPQPIAEEFLKKFERYFFVNMPVVEVGISTLDTILVHQIPFKYILALEGRKTISLSEMLNAFRKVEKYNKKCDHLEPRNVEYEILFMDPGLKTIRYLLPTQRVVQNFMVIYCAGLRCNIRLEDNKLFMVSDRGEEFPIVVEKGLFVCQCRFKEKTGLPCRHLIKMIWAARVYNYHDYVSDKWKQGQLVVDEPAQTLKTPVNVEPPRKPSRAVDINNQLSRFAFDYILYK